MRTVCNRYNPQKLVEVLKKHEWLGGPTCSMTYGKRWQVTVVDKRGRHYDHYFVAKPTRKQIRKLHKVKQSCIRQNCYECGKRIPIDQAFSWDDLNFAHSDCVGK